MFPLFCFPGRRGPPFRFVGCFLFSCLIGSVLSGRDDDPREITIEQPDGTQETYVLLGTGTTDYEGYNFPEDILLSRSNFNENLAPGAQSITLSARDPDVGDEHEFGLVAGTGGEDNAAFTLVGNELRSNATYDFEAKSNYSVLISAIDSSGLSVVKAFTITIDNDFADDPPSNLVFVAPLTIAENQQVGTIVGEFNATDPGAGGSLVYELVSGSGDSHNALFSLDANGTLRTTTILDFESNGPALTVRVRVTDEQNAFVEKTFTITIDNDHADEPPSNLVFVAPLTIAENQQVGTIVGEFNATDPGAGGSLVYELVSGSGDSHNALFSLDANGTLRTTTILDFESNGPALTVRVRVTDEQNAFVEKTFTISVTDTHLPLVRTLPHEKTNRINHRSSQKSQAYRFAGEILATGGTPLLQIGIEISQRLAFSNPSRLPANPTLRFTRFSVYSFSLEPDQRYYYRAYATNAEGTLYGSPKRLTTAPASRTWWAQMSAIGGGWRNSEWFGTFRRHESTDWIYHAQLGWAFALPDEEKGLWLWKSDIGWLWTNTGVYPFLFSDRSGGWMYFRWHPFGSLLFYDYSSKRWITRQAGW